MGSRVLQGRRTNTTDRPGADRTSLVAFALLLAAAAAAAMGCDELSDSLNGGGGGGSVAHHDPELASLAKALPAGPPMTRNLSNREYLNVISDLIGERLPPELTASWTKTTQFSGFDAVPWSNLDTKAARDLSETIEVILDRVVASPKVMTCAATTAEELPYDACARSVVEPFAARGYGRPLTDAEREAFEARYADGVALAQTALTEPKEIFTDGVRAALGSALLAPQLVTRIERPPTAEFVGERDLDPYELASRLAFMFNASIPDDELWAKAEDGSLAQPDVLAAEVERLLDTKTDLFVQSFMGQWFDFRAWDGAPPGTLEHTMWTESWRTLADVVKEDLPITALVEPGFTYLNRDLAAHYNLPGVEVGGELARVATKERGGVLQQGSWLTLSASPLKTSPIHRGRLVQDRLLCKVIPPPDPSLFEKIQEVTDSISPDASVKERLDIHRNTGEACAGCHTYMDPIGLGLEGFDMRGRLRSAYADGRPVETASNLLGTPFSTFSELNSMLADLPDYHRCAAEKLAVYATRRVIDADADAELLAYLTHSSTGEPPSMRAMITRLVSSDAFRKVHHGGAK